MEGYLFRFAPQKEKASQPSLSRYRYFIKKAEKALLQSAFSKNPVISFSVLRAKSVTVVDTISTTVTFYLLPVWECFWNETGDILNKSGHKQIVCPDLMRPWSEKTGLGKT